MKKRTYKVYVGMNCYLSESRNSRQHLINHGGDCVIITDMHDRIISKAMYCYDGSILVTTDCKGETI